MKLIHPTITQTKQLRFNMTHNFIKMSQVLTETQGYWPSLAIIMGEDGTGKTTCALQYVKANPYSAYLKISDKTNEKEFASMLCEAVGTRFNGMSDWEKNWNIQWHHLSHGDSEIYNRMLFVIDDFSFKRPLIAMINSLLSETRPALAFVLIDSMPMKGRGYLDFKNSLYVKGHYRRIELSPLQKSDLQLIWEMNSGCFKVEYEDFMKSRSWNEINNLLI